MNEIKAEQEKMGVSISEQTLKYFKLLSEGDMLDHS
jgi:hypothetical protein